MLLRFLDIISVQSNRQTDRQKSLAYVSVSTSMLSHHSCIHATQTNHMWCRKKCDTFEFNKKHAHSVPHCILSADPRCTLTKLHCSWLHVQTTCLVNTKQHLHHLLVLTRKLCYRKDDRAMRAIWVDRELLRRCGHSKLSKMATAAILNLFEPEIAPSPKTLP